MLEPRERRYHPASGKGPALNKRCFVALRFPLLKPTGSRFLFQGNLSEGSVLVVEFSHFYHRHQQQAIPFLSRGAGGMLLGHSSLIGLPKNGP